MICATCGTTKGVRYIEFGDGFAIPYCRRHQPMFAAWREFHEALVDCGRTMSAYFKNLRDGVGRKP